MELKDIVSVSGMGGLHQVVAQRSNGLILETLDASKKRFPTNTNTKVSILSDIAIYTVSGEKPFKEVIKKVFEKEKDGLKVPDKKAENSDYVDFMAAILPDYDTDRVYVSDIKKLTNWYTILRDFSDISSLVADSETEEKKENAVESTETAEAKPAKKAKTEKTKTVAKSTTVKANTKTAGGAKKLSAPRKTGGGS